MPLSSSLTKPLRWLRADHPAQAPRHGYAPLIALMPGPAAQAVHPPIEHEHSEGNQDLRALT
jgi:hypothetical protein